MKKLNNSIVFEAKPNWWEINYDTKDYSKSHQTRSQFEISKEINFLRKLIWKNKNFLWIDLACAEGKHLYYLEEIGYLNLIGIDISKFMIEKASNSLHRSNIQFIQGDMKAIKEYKFSPKIITIFYNSIGFFSTDIENINLFKFIFESLEENGYFFFDFFPSTYLLANIRECEETIYNNEKIIIRERYDIDNKRLIRNTKIESKKNTSERTSSQRIFKLEEINKLLIESGFRNIEYFGDYKRGKYNAEKHTKICVLAKKPSSIN